MLALHVAFKLRGIIYNEKIEIGSFYPVVRYGDKSERRNC